MGKAKENEFMFVFVFVHEWVWVGAKLVSGIARVKRRRQGHEQAWDLCADMTRNACCVSVHVHTNVTQ